MSKKNNKQNTIDLLSFKNKKQKEKESIHEQVMINEQIASNIMKVEMFSSDVESVVDNAIDYGLSRYEIALLFANELKFLIEEIDEDNEYKLMGNVLNVLLRDDFDID